MSAPERFPLSSGLGLRMARWLGRVLTIMALWPLWYAFYGKPSLDTDALSFGAPGVVIGVALWWWSGYRLRNPNHAVEVDRAAGEIRLLRGGPVVARCALDELGEWSYRTWRTTSVNKGVRSVTNWCAARAPGLGEQDLYVDTEAQACHAWTARVDAARRGETATDTTVGALLAARADAATASMAVVVPAVLIALSLALGAWLTLVVQDSDGRQTTSAVILAVFVGLVVLGWRGVERPLIGALTAAVFGAVLCAKPFVAPITSEFMGEVHAMSVTSETHFYFLLPGLALLGVAVLSVLAKKVQVAPALATTSGAPAPVRLEAPRPLPPRPEPPGEA